MQEQPFVLGPSPPHAGGRDKIQASQEPLVSQRAGTCSAEGATGSTAILAASVTTFPTSHWKGLLSSLPESRRLPPFLSWANLATVNLRRALEGYRTVLLQLLPALCYLPGALCSSSSRPPSSFLPSALCSSGNPAELCPALPGAASPGDLGHHLFCRQQSRPVLPVLGCVLCFKPRESPPK